MKPLYSTLGNGMGKTVIFLICAVLFIWCENKDEPEPAPGSPTEKVGWIKHTVDDNCLNLTSMEAFDLDGDFDLDLIVPDAGHGDLIWYENKSPQWTKGIIDYNAGIITHALCSDINGDGIPEVVANNSTDGIIMIYSKQSDTWSKTIAIAETDHAGVMHLADINKDGKTDILVAENSENTEYGDIIWYENQHPDWVKHIIADGKSQYESIHALDADCDGQMDVVLTAAERNEVILYRNLGKGFDWSRTTIDNDLPNAYRITSCHVNNDGACDLVVTSGGTIFAGSSVIWYENSYPGFTKHIINNRLLGASYAGSADFNDDGVKEIIAAGYHEGRVVWYDQPAWKEHVIDNYLSHPKNMLSSDLNRDGKMDILVSSKNGIYWYEQKDNYSG